LVIWLLSFQMVITCVTIIVLKMWSHFEILLFKIILNNIKRAQFEQGLVQRFQTPWQHSHSQSWNPQVEVSGLALFHFPTLVGTCSSHGQLGLSFGSFPLSCPNDRYKPKTKVVTLTWHTNNLEPWIIVHFKLVVHLYIIFKA
jgi:hypothetical protein